MQWLAGSYSCSLGAVTTSAFLQVSLVDLLVPERAPSTPLPPFVTEIVTGQSLLLLSPIIVARIHTAHTHGTNTAHTATAAHALHAHASTHPHVIARVFQVVLCIPPRIWQASSVTSTTRSRTRSVAWRAWWRWLHWRLALTRCGNPARATATSSPTPSHRLRPACT